MTENARTSKLANFSRKFAKFFRDIKNELKKVIWPTRNQLVNYTLTVLLFCLLFGIVIWVSDTVFGTVVEWTLTK